VGFGFRYRFRWGGWPNPEKLGGVYLVAALPVFMCRQPSGPYGFKDGFGYYCPTPEIVKSAK
jgi:hypothetical protein